MRNLIVCNIVSLDGFYEGPGGDVMALPFDIYRAERLRAADTLLVGRKSYEGLKSYRPPIADDPAAPPVEREVSRLDNATDKVVVSESLTPDQTTPWPNTDIVVHGHHLAGQLTQADVDNTDEVTRDRLLSLFRGLRR